MPRKYYRITEVVELCGVDEGFVLRLERERLIAPVLRRREKVYPPAEVDRVRVARTLMEELGVNLEGVEVVLPMRERMIALQRALEKMMRRMREGR